LVSLGRLYHSIERSNIITACNVLLHYKSYQKVVNWLLHADLPQIENANTVSYRCSRKLLLVPLQLIAPGHSH